MPTYCFKNRKSGKVIECEYKMSDVPKSVKRSGKIFERDLKSEMVAVPATKGWPMECYASGVNASQAGDLRDHFKKNGLNIEVSRDGNPIYASAGQRRKGLKCRNLIDKSAYI